jgi:hypothetical protein
MNSRTIFLSTLIVHGACRDQVDLFRTTFGDSVEITPNLCKQYAQSFNYTWAAQHLLSATALELYDETCATARELNEETCATAWKLYDETCATARKLNEETCATAWKLNKETCATAWKLYDETCASTFANLYIGD